MRIQVKRPPGETSADFSAPAKPVDLTLTFQHGLPVKLQVGGKVYTDSLELFGALNDIGEKNGIGRIDIVEVCSP